MKGDFTRFNFGNEARYVSVLNQQGRVSLDSDWNEAEAIDDWQRRQRTIDTVGSFAVVGDEAFKVTYVAAFDDFVIAPGRAYVDGHLIEARTHTSAVTVSFCDDLDEAAETHGAATHLASSPNDLGVTDSDAPEPVVLFCPEVDRLALVIDDHTIRGGSLLRLDLDDGTALLLRTRRVENHWIADVDDADLLVRLTADSTAVLTVLTTVRTQLRTQFDGNGEVPAMLDVDASLVVLDVWQRNRTAVEDPALLEEALGGPDTTTRVQTTWMARVVPIDRRNPTCSDDHSAELGPLASPTSGRLSSRSIPGGAFTDPCLLPPDAGYRGLQNRLYRVEVHESGDTLAETTFKWSAHNGSALASFTADGTTIEVSDVGRGELGLGFAPLVELFDEQNELEMTPGLLLAPRARTDASSRQFEFSEDVSSTDGRPWASLPRARRWDGMLSDLDVGDEVEVLGDGVLVAFTEGRYRSGDYWLIPARTHSGEIKTLDEAAPNGVAHSVAKLAVVERDSSETVRVTSDCRRCIRPLVDHNERCQPEISVGSCGDVPTIPEAIRLAHELSAATVDRGADELVTIRLLAGVHHLEAPQRIRRSNVRITGCGAESRVLCAAQTDKSPVGIPAFIAVGSTANPTTNLTFDNFEILGASSLGLVVASGVSALSLERMRMMLDADLLRPEGAAAVSVLDSSDVSITNSVLEGRVALPDVLDKSYKLFVPQYGAVSIDGTDISVESNRIRGAGVWIRHGSRHVVIADNELTGMPSGQVGSERSGAGILLGERYPWQEQLFDADGLPDTALTRIEIRRNKIRDYSWSGIATLSPESMEINIPEIDQTRVEVPVDDVETDGLKWCYPRLSRTKAIDFNAVAIDDWMSRDFVLPPRPVLMSLATVAASFVPISLIYLGGTVLSAFVQPTDVDVCDNFISNCAHSSEPDERVDRRVHGGIILRGVRNVRINGNQILRNATRSRGVGIWLDEAFDAELLDNRVEGNGRRDPVEQRPPIEDFRSRVIPKRVDAFGMGFLSGRRELALTVEPDPVPATDSAPDEIESGLIAVDAGYPIGYAFKSAGTLTFPEATQSSDLAVSLLPVSSEVTSIPAAVSLADGTVENIDITVGSRVERSFAAKVASIRFGEHLPFVLSHIEWGPVHIQGGVVVLGALGTRSFGTAGKSSLRIDRNVVVSPAGPALIAQLLGDGASVVNNTLSSQADATLPSSLLRRLDRMFARKVGVCVTVVGDAVEETTETVSSDTTRDQRRLRAPLRFSENRIQWSNVSADDGEVTYCVALQGADIQFSDNTIEAIVRDGRIYSNVALEAETARVLGNRISESTCSAKKSLQIVVANRAVVVGNQFDHAVSLQTTDGDTIAVDGALNSLSLANCRRWIFDSVASLAGDDLVRLANLRNAASRSLTKSFAGSDAASMIAVSVRNATKYSATQLLDSSRTVAAGFFVKSVAALTLARESLEAIGEEGRELATAADRLHLADLAVTYTKLASAVVDAKRPGSIRPPYSGTVLAADGRAIAGATVVFEDESGQELESITTGSDGRLDEAALKKFEETRSDLAKRLPNSKIRFRVLAAETEAKDDIDTEIATGELPPFVKGTRLSFDLATNYRLPSA